MLNDQSFSTAELVACAKREAGYRRSCYPKWDGVTNVDALSPKRKKELAMMEAIAERLTETTQTELTEALTAQFIQKAEAQGGLRGILLYLAHLNPADVTEEWREKMAKMYRQEGGTALD